MICKWIAILFLNEFELTYLHKIKWIQELLLSARS